MILLKSGESGNLKEKISVEEVPYEVFYGMFLRKAAWKDQTLKSVRNPVIGQVL